MNNYIGYTVYLYMDNGRDISGDLVWISNTCMCVCVKGIKHVVATDNVYSGIVFIRGERHFFI